MSASRRKVEALVERILWHLANRSQQLCWSGTDDDRDDARIAWWTVYYAWQGNAAPYERAHGETMSAKLERRAALLAELESYGPADRDLPFRVEGRTAEEWHRSICAYLEWRLASVSRIGVPTRLQPEARPISDALWLVKQAYTGSTAVTRIHAKEASVDVHRDQDAQRPVPAADDRRGEHGHERSADGDDQADGRADLRPCRNWRRDVRAGCRAARGCRACLRPGARMNLIHPDFLELAGANLAARDLFWCFAQQLALLLQKEHGDFIKGGAAIGTHRVTLCRWNAGGKRVLREWLQQPWASEERVLELRQACGRIAERLLREEQNNAEAIFRRLRRGIAAAAISLEKGNKRRAARRLKASEYWLLDRSQENKLGRSA